MPAPLASPTDPTDLTIQTIQRRSCAAKYKKYITRLISPKDAMSKLGEFEMLVLLSILRQRRTPYANRVRADLEENAGRAVTRGALYRTLDRLTEKGFVAWDMVPSDVPERGGHPMRRLSVTEAGVEAVRSTRDVLATFMEGLDPILDPL